MSRDTIARINVAAANHNLQIIRKQSGNAKIWAVVKADAYGHGASILAPQFIDCDGYAVATLAEALELRQAKIDKPILLLEGCIFGDQSKIALDNDLSLVLHCIEQIEDLEKYTQQGDYADLTVWLKVDSGMHRLGFATHDIAVIFSRLEKIKGVKHVGLMSHFASADEIENDFTQVQIDRLLQNLPQNCSLISMANSAAIFNYPESHNDWVRPGIALYGATPIRSKSAKELGLLPVMQLVAPIIAIREIEAGESTGYGLSWTAQRHTKIATVAIGYADGYPRTCKQGTPVFVNAQRAPLIGRVSMDMITIDVTDIDVSIYDEVELWGENVSVDEVATYCDTIGYELLTRLAKRVEHQYV